MSSVRLKRLYKELPVWIVEDHHDVSLEHWRTLTRSCPIHDPIRRFLVQDASPRGKPATVILWYHTDVKPVLVLPV